MKKQLLPMNSLKSQMLFPMILVSIVFLSMCLTSDKTDITSAVKLLPEVQTFLNEHPNAEVKAALWSASAVDKNIESIRADCGPQMESKSYWKAEVNENDLDLIIWLDSDSKQPVCVIKKRVMIPPNQTTTSTPTFIPIVTQTAFDHQSAAGDKVSVFYVGRLDDGTLFDTNNESVARSAGVYNQQRQYVPFEFTLGSGQVIVGFDKAVTGMKVGETKQVRIPPEEAYGEQGPLAGKTLNFEIRLVSISAKTATGFASLQVKDWKLDSTGAVTIVMDNKYGASMSITGMSVNRTSGTMVYNCSIVSTTTLAENQETTYITTSGNCATGLAVEESYTADVQIYFTANGVSHIDSGTLTGKVE